MSALRTAMRPRQPEEVVTGWTLHVNPPGNSTSLCGAAWRLGTLYDHTPPPGHPGAETIFTVCGPCLHAAQTAGAEPPPGDHEGAAMFRRLLAQLGELQSQPREPGPFDRRRVRAVVEFDISLDGFAAGETGPSPFGIAERIDHAMVAAVAAMPGVADARCTDFALGDPPRETSRGSGVVT